MERISQNVPKNWNYFLFGDSHIGARLRHTKGWDKLVKMMNRPYHGVDCNLGIDHGDMIEAITVDDPRYCEYDTLEQNILNQMYSAQKALWPIRDKLVCGLDGNHPYKLHKFGDITRKICKEVGITYGGYSAVITFKNKGKTQFKHYAHHGSGQINSVADDPERKLVNMLISLKRKLSPMMSDCLLMSMGHTHKFLILPPSKELYLTTNDDGTIEQHYTEGKHAEYIHPNHRWYVNTSTFLRLLDNEGGGSGYGERALFPPNENGFAVAEIRNGKILRINKEVI